MGKSIVAVRHLKARLSEYLEQVSSGDIVEVTSRGKLIARIVPAGAESVQKDPMDLVKEGFANWNGKKVPSGKPRIRFKDGSLASDLVLKNRE